MVGRKLTTEQKQEYSELFFHYDKDGSGQVPIKKVDEMLMSCGLSPTQQEMQNVKKALTKAGKRSINLVDFIKLIRDSSFSNNDAKDDILSAFHFYDKIQSRGQPTGFITMKDLRHVMTNYGGRLRENELTNLIKAVQKSKDVAKRGDGAIN